MSLLLLFIVLLLVGFPIIAAMGIPSILYVIIKGLPASIVSYSIYQSLNTFTLVAVPMFILLGNLINEFKETERIFNFAKNILKNKKGYSARVNVLASLIFSGISGAALADIAGLGQLEIRAMENEGFSRSYAAAVTTATSIVGPIFPPSIPLIIYAMTAEVSTLKCLIAGALPGILIAIVLYIFILTQIKKKKLKPKEENKPTNESESILKIFLEALPMLIAVPAIIVAMLSGVFSPSEAGVAGVVYILLVGVLHKEITFQRVRKALKRTYQTTSGILLIVSMGFVFTKMLTLEHLPQTVARGFFSISNNPIILLLLINLLSLVMGMFMEGISSIVLLTPIFLPIAQIIGVDPIHLGVILVYNFMIGLSTPPFGLGVYTVANVGEIAPEKVFKEILPLYIPLIVSLLIITFLPKLSLWLPDLFF